MDTNLHEKACADRCRKGLCRMECTPRGKSRWCAEVDRAAAATTGERLSRIMEEHGISKRRLAQAAGVSHKTVCRICNGDRVGNLDTWLRIADALGCGVEELVE